MTSVSTTSTTTSAGSAAEEQTAATPATTTAKSSTEEDKPTLGFLLKWETPVAANLPGIPTISINNNDGIPTSNIADTKLAPGLSEDNPEQEEANGVLSNAEVGAATEGGDRESRVLYGSGDRRRGHGRGQGQDKGRGKQSSMDRDTSAAASAALSSPTYLWLSPRQIELGGGAVVRALTMADKTAYADVQYHWKLGETRKMAFFNIVFVAATVFFPSNARYCFVLVRSALSLANCACPEGCRRCVFFFLHHHVFFATFKDLVFPEYVTFYLCHSCQHPTSSSFPRLRKARVVNVNISFAPTLYARFPTCRQSCPQRSLPKRRVHQMRRAKKEAAKTARPTRQKEKTRKRTARHRPRVKERRVSSSTDRTRFVLYRSFETPQGLSTLKTFQ